MQENAEIKNYQRIILIGKPELTGAATINKFVDDVNDSVEIGPTNPEG